jgi:[ribosomal protein S5]-alanine N-acetyltransferase
MLNLHFDPFPIIRSDRLVLREISERDTDRVYELSSDPNVMKYIDRPLAKSKTDALHWITNIQSMSSKQEAITWGISLSGNEALIGTIGFWSICREHYRAEIGYMLTPKEQGKGIMREAMLATIPYGFEKMKLHSIEANVNPSNHASIKVLERLKFTREAYFRENYYFEGKFLETAIYS